MTQIILSINFEKFRYARSRSYDSGELERQYLWQVDQLPYGATVRLDTGFLPPIPHNLSWHRYGLEYEIVASDVTTAKQWASMLDQHLDALVGNPAESWQA